MPIAAIAAKAIVRGTYLKLVSFLPEQKTITGFQRIVKTHGDIYFARRKINGKSCRHVLRGVKFKIPYYEKLNIE